MVKTFGMVKNIYLKAFLTKKVSIFDAQVRHKMS